MIHLPHAPTHLPHVRMLRTIDDADAIDCALATASHVAVVGGGFIGCEIASTARARGLDATIIDRTPTLLTSSLGPALGAVVGDIHRDAGVRLHLGVEVTGWTETRTGVQISLDDGETITADAAVVGIGTHPRTDWLRGNGLDLTNGILCTPTCHARNIDGTAIASVVAAGDIARWPNLRFDATPRRIEHGSTPLKWVKPRLQRYSRVPMQPNRSPRSRDSGPTNTVFASNRKECPHSEPP